MTTQDPNATPRISPDGKWQWDGHNWVPRQPQPAPQMPPQSGPQQYAVPPPGQQQYGVPQPGYAQPGYPQPKKGMPLWGKIGIGLGIAFVALIVLLTAVGLLVDSNDYSAWSCQDVADRAVKISDENGGMLVLTKVTDLTIAEDHRTDFTPPDTGRGVVLSCTGTGSWDQMGDTPVTVELSADNDGQEWVRYQMAD